MGKQVKTPRFYVDMPSFLHATGQLGWDEHPKGGADLLYMNASNPIDTPYTSGTFFGIGHPHDNPPKTSFPINFCALLNHNFASDTHKIEVVGKKGLGQEDSSDRPRLHDVGYSNVLNTNSISDDMGPSFNGTSIFTFTEQDEYWRAFEIYYGDVGDDGVSWDTNVTHQLGSMVIGKYWDAPNSPDLNLTMSRRFEGIKRQKTIGGKTLANIYYDGPTEWTMNGPDGIYKYPPFELDLSLSVEDDLEGSNVFHSWRAKSGLGRKGLRSWKLTFSYISEDDMWMAYESSSIAPFSDGDSGYDATTDTDIPTDDGNSVASLTNPNPMLSDDSFNFVWNCTLGGTLPFIFQPDNTNSNPDQFSICTFRGNSLSVKQVAFNTYSLSVTIDEVA